MREPREAWLYGTGDKNNKDEKSVNERQIFHWEVSNGKTGLPFQEFHLFWKISSGFEPKSRVPFTFQPEFPEFFGKWKKGPILSIIIKLDRSAVLEIQKDIE